MNKEQILIDALEKLVEVVEDLEDSIRGNIRSRNTKADKNLRYVKTVLKDLKERSE
jgi:hypothetical protein